MKSPWSSPNSLRRYAAWIVVAAVILLVVVVRVRLRDLPLERDEGEYAYAGQLMLQGIPPYKLAYNMKLPGSYAAYALIMAVFGQTPAGIHLGLALVNVATILLIFLIGRKILDDVAGAAAAVSFAILSLSPNVLGLAAHATHFVVLCGVGGLWLLLRAVETGKRQTWFLSGLLFGCAFLMKQHGVFFAVFGMLYLVWARLQGLTPAGSGGDPKRSVQPSTLKMAGERPALSRRRGRSNGGASWFARLMESVLARQGRWGALLKEAAVFAGGMVTPLALTLGLLLASGVFERFWFWTVDYARAYVAVAPRSEVTAMLRQRLEGVTGPNLVFWVLAAMGMVLMWWEERAHRHRVFLTGLLIFSILAICPGLYFREHYFILLLPALVLLAGVAVSRGIHLVRHEKSVEVLLALPILGMFVVGMVYAVVEHGAVWFDSSPEQACRRIYKGQFFAESVEVGRYLRDHSAEKARIAVLGSEPQIYFYARRHSATGYIYMYPLMEPHRYSVRMQAEMIGELEAARPEYVVFVSLEWSWGFRPTSERRLLDWWTGYRLNYDLVGIVDRSADEQPIYKWEGAVAGYQPGSPQHVLVFKRRN